jgi:predicted dehydrogenase
LQRALIIGAGVSGFLHALALRSAGCTVAGVFDPELERAALLASLVGGVPTDSFDAIANDERHAEVVAVCSPPPFHVEQAERLGRPGRLLFVEKPVALTHAELERLRRVPNVVPVLQWRAGRAARELRAALRANAFGGHPRLRLALRLWRDEAYFGARGHALWGCGAMLSIGIHAIDLLLWLVGRPILGASGREWHGRANVDVGTGGELIVCFEGGAHAELSVTLDAEGANEVRLVVTGASASAELVAGEGDPTASALALHGVDRGAFSSAGGASGSPLLVPFVHEALAAFRSGAPMLSVADVAQAHALAVRISAQ